MFICDKCGKSFNYQSKLAEHLANATNCELQTIESGNFNVISFNCHLCDKPFSTIGSRNRHFRECSIKFKKKESNIKNIYISQKLIPNSSLSLTSEIKYNNTVTNNNQCVNIQIVNSVDKTCSSKTVSTNLNTHNVNIELVDQTDKTKNLKQTAELKSNIENNENAKVINKNISNLDISNINNHVEIDDAYNNKALDIDTDQSEDTKHIAQKFLQKIESDFKHFTKKIGKTVDKIYIVEIREQFLLFKNTLDKSFNINSKAKNQCQFQACEKYASFNYEGKIAVYCSSHKKDEMINVKSKRCKTEYCNIQVSQKKYQGYCLRCFINTFPDGTTARNYKTKEKTVVDFIKEKFTNINWICNKKVENGFSRRRPDIYADMNTHIVIIEIDENQHQAYDCLCDNKRLMEISQDFQHRPIVFVRFNPDSYISQEGKKVKSCWAANSREILVIKGDKKLEWSNRLNALSDQIQYWLENPTEKTVEVIHLFYDGFNS